MKFNVVAGMPRSGSTLLCNILNQNPDFYASSTSCMGQTVRSISNLWSFAPEIKSELIHDKDGTDERMHRSIRSLLGAWYKDTGKVVFDKCRAWNYNAPLLRHIFPESRMLVCVRDLRDIFASIEKQHAKNPILDEAVTPDQLTVYNRADRMFAPEGLIGQPLHGVMDLVQRNLPFVYIIEYEIFVKSPDLILDRLYAALGEKRYPHDLEAVSNVASDVDGLYLNKYPHEGSGKVEPSNKDWKEFISKDIADAIIERFPGYNKQFGYY